MQTLLTGIHKADVTIIQEIAKGQEAKSLIQQVSGFYVTNKQRLAMDEKDGTLTPAGWLFFRGTTDFWQYGITNLTIDGIQTSSNFDYPKRKDKKIPLKEENGKTIKIPTARKIDNMTVNVVSIFSCLSFAASSICCLFSSSSSS